MPETTGINKEDLLIVEDGQGTKKGTVQQLDEALWVSQLKEDLEGLTYTYTYEKNIPLNKRSYLIVNHKFEKYARIVVKCADNIGITILKNGKPEVLRQYGVVPVTVIDVKANDYVGTIEFSGFSNPTANISIELNSSEKIENETISDDLVVHNYGTLVKHYYYGYEYTQNNNWGYLKSNESKFCTNKLPIIKGKDIYIDSTGASVAIFYDVNGDILLFRNISFAHPMLSTDIPSDAYYVSFSLDKSSPVIENGIGQHGLDKKQTADFLMNNCSVATYTPVNTNGWTSNVWNNEIRNSWFILMLWEDFS